MTTPGNELALSTGTLLCPRCGKPRAAGTVECPACGVIYARFRPARPAADRAAQATGAAPSGAPPPGPVAPNLSPATLEAVLTGLSTMLQAGLPLTAMLPGPALGTLPPPVQRKFTEDAFAGVPLSSTLESLQLVDAAGAALLRAGEATGGVPAALLLLAERSAERRKDRNKVLLAMIYPLLMLLAAGLILPAAELWTNGVRSYLYRAAPMVGLFAGIVAVTGWLAFFPPAPGSLLRRVWSSVAGVTPLLSSIGRHRGISRFTEVLGSCVKAGLPIRGAVGLAAGASGSPALEARGPDLVAALDGGSTLAAALGGTGGFPPDALAELEIGERTGTLDQTLLRLGVRHRQRARTLTIAALVAATVAFLILAVVLSISALIAGYRHNLEEFDRQIDNATR